MNELLQSHHMIHLKRKSKNSKNKIKFIKKGFYIIKKNWIKLKMENLPGVLVYKISEYA